MGRCSLAAAVRGMMCGTLVCEGRKYCELATPLLTNRCRAHEAVDIETERVALKAI